MEDKSTISPKSNSNEQQETSKLSDDYEQSTINEPLPIDEKVTDESAIFENVEHTSPQEDLGEISLNEEVLESDYLQTSPGEQLEVSTISPVEWDTEVEVKVAVENSASIDVNRTKSPIIDLKEKKIISVQNRLSKTIQKAPVIAKHMYLYKEAALVVQNPILPKFQSSLDSKHKAREPKSGILSVEQYPGHTKNLALERYDLAYYKQACCQKWTPNPTGCNMVRPVKLRRSVRSARVQSIDDWKIVEENLKELRDHEIAVELGYETLVGNLLYIDIPNGRDINRCWQNYLSEDIMEWGFPFYKGTTERPRMRQPEPYLAHQVVEKLWKVPKATRRRANSVDDLNLN